MKSIRNFVRHFSRKRWDDGSTGSTTTHWFKQNYEIVMPAFVSPKTLFTDLPKNISLPSYAESGIPPSEESLGTSPEIKSPEDIIKMRESCQLAKMVLEAAGKLVKPGVTTQMIDDFVFEMIVSHGAYPSPLNYREFPKSVCTSVNNCVCHGIPDSRFLIEGDIINIDITVYLDGFHGDCSKTYAVGDIDIKAKKLIQTTEECLNIGIDLCHPGQCYSAIGARIEAHAKHSGFKIIPMFAGHGIGTYFHGPPDIYHIRNSYIRNMEPGVTFTIEPILSEGSDEVFILDDNWTAITADNSRAAQAEHTVLITDTGCEILTI